MEADVEVRQELDLWRVLGTARIVRGVERCAIGGGAKGQSKRETGKGDCERCCEWGGSGEGSWPVN